MYLSLGCHSVFAICTTCIICNPSQFCVYAIVSLLTKHKGNYRCAYKNGRPIKPQIVQYSRNEGILVINKINYYNNQDILQLTQLLKINLKRTKKHISQSTKCICLERSFLSSPLLSNSGTSYIMRPPPSTICCS